jgi:hypothetical protein
MEKHERLMGPVRSTAVAIESTTGVREWGSRHEDHHILQRRRQ